MSPLPLLDAVVLGVVEGLTEFLPVSSTGHLTITEKLLGLPIDDPAVTGYTAVIQMGAIGAVIIYFRRDLVRLIGAFFRGLVRPADRGHDYRMAWKVGLGSIPVGIVGFLARDLISGPLRSLWVVAIALLGWSVVMVWAERVGTKSRPEEQLSFTDAVIIGIAQCAALVPGDLAIWSVDLRWPVPQSGAGGRHPHLVPPVDPGAARGRSLRAQGRGRR